MESSPIGTDPVGGAQSEPEGTTWGGGGGARRIVLVTLILLVPPAVLWDRIDAPVGAAALWIGGLAIWLTRTTWLRVVGLVLVGVAAVEFALYAIAPPRGDSHGADVHESHPVLGYVATPGASDRAEHRFGGELVYSVDVSIDDEGLRISPPPPESPPERSVLCFGCSFMFGVGVTDEQAVPYRIEEELGGEVRVYNLALGGWGTHQALAQLEIGRVDAVVDEPPVVAIYWCLPEHIWRTAGKAPWDRRGPLYEVDEDGRAVRVGTFADLDGPPPPSDRPRGLRKRSWILRRLVAVDGEEELRHPPPEDVERWAAVVRALRDTVERRFEGCRFHVLFDDRSTRGCEEALAVLDECGIRYTLVSSVLPRDPDDPYRWILHRSEWHPNPDAVERVVRHLVDDVVLPILSEGDSR